MTGLAPPIVREAGAGQSRPPVRRVREDAVKSIWMEQPWGSGHIRDVKGRKLEIISPGWLHGSSGPDFKNAVFRIDGGAAEKGDVEIHVRSSDWNFHKHNTDPRYNNTRLHVVLYCDSRAAARFTSDGAPLVEIELAPICAGALDRIRSHQPLAPGMADMKSVTGRCAASLQRIGEEKTAMLLEAAGEGRCELKSRRYMEAMRRGEGREELYSGIFEAMGYSAFKSQFRGLAVAAPLSKTRAVLENVTARKRPAVMTAILMGAAGLLVNPVTMAGGLDFESSEFINNLWEIWTDFGQRHEIKAAFTREDWRFAGTRPANFPQGRIAALAHFLASHAEGDMESLFVRAVDNFPAGGAKREIAAWMDGFSRLFPSPQESYFARRYTFGGKVIAGGPRRLVGPERAGIIFINVAAPYLLARARMKDSRADEEKIRLAFHASAAAEKNSVISFMSDRLLGNRPGMGRGTAAMQGLIQIYSDFCVANERGCGDCRFAAYAEKMASVAGKSMEIE